MLLFTPITNNLDLPYITSSKINTHKHETKTFIWASTFSEQTSVVFPKDSPMALSFFAREKLHLKTSPRDSISIRPNRLELNQSSFKRTCHNRCGWIINFYHEVSAPENFSGFPCCTYFFLRDIYGRKMTRYHRKGGEGTCFLTSSRSRLSDGDVIRLKIFYQRASSPSEEFLPEIIDLNCKSAV